jgi:DNA-binding NarL/FixJ family response regulator
VVLAEDNAGMAEQLKALLGAEHDVVDVVRDGLALVRAVEASRPDVIVADIAMPGLSGLAAAQAIVARDPAARIVFVTVQDEATVIRTALSGPARGYVVKADAGEELPSAMRAVLAGGRYVSSSARAALEGPRALGGAP